MLRALLDEPKAVNVLLREDHACLRRLFDDVLHRFAEDNREETRRAWSIFEAVLTEHLESEEAVLFPGFRVAHPLEYKALANDHAFFRKALEAMAITVDLHTIRADSAQELIEMLEAHGEREDGCLYVWATDQARAAPSASCPAAAVVK